MANEELAKKLKRSDIFHVAVRVFVEGAYTPLLDPSIYLEWNISVPFAIQAAKVMKSRFKI
jgi:intracellular septation protein A